MTLVATDAVAETEIGVEPRVDEGRQVMAFVGIALQWLPYC